jgi:hypothetical protein
MELLGRSQGGGMVMSILVCSVLLLVGGVEGWDNAELEMYDLIEEMGQNFYDVLGLPHVRIST